ncbi:MAG: hypothetical protein KKH76_03560, partial [Euryarchaeota archaeon]|nr:hypothetical protein [Euryarchaeota archaeon]
MPANNIRENPDGEKPEISATSFIDPKAVVIGNVKIGNNV